MSIFDPSYANLGLCISFCYWSIYFRGWQQLKAGHFGDYILSHWCLVFHLIESPARHKFIFTWIWFEILFIFRVPVSQLHILLPNLDPGLLVHHSQIVTLPLFLSSFTSKLTAWLQFGILSSSLLYVVAAIFLYLLRSFTSLRPLSASWLAREWAM